MPSPVETSGAETVLVSFGENGLAHFSTENNDAHEGHWDFPWEKPRSVLHTVPIPTFIFSSFSIMTLPFSINGVRQLSKSTIPLFPNTASHDSCEENMNRPYWRS